MAENSFKMPITNSPLLLIQIFRDRSFMWFPNFFLAKFLEIGKFLRRQSVSIFRATAHALHSTGFLGRLLEGSSRPFRSKTFRAKNNVCVNQIIRI